MQNTEKHIIYPFIPYISLSGMASRVCLFVRVYQWICLCLTRHQLCCGAGPSWLAALYCSYHTVGRWCSRLGYGGTQHLTSHSQLRLNCILNNLVYFFPERFKCTCTRECKGTQTATDTRVPVKAV